MRVGYGFFAAAAAALVSTGAAAQTATVSYGAVNTVENGSTVFANYDDLNPATSGGMLEVSPPGGIPGQAAPVGSGNFGYVVGQSNVSYTLSTATGFTAARRLSFDAGSLDPYNFINLDFANGTSQAFGGPFGPFTPADSSRLIFTAAGAKITGFTLGSGDNSFEFDNLALGGVPEPSTWALMIVGFGAVGGAMRRRVKVQANVSFA